MMKRMLSMAVATNDQTAQTNIVLPNYLCRWENLERSSLMFARMTMMKLTNIIEKKADTIKAIEVSKKKSVLSSRLYVQVIPSALL